MAVPLLDVNAQNLALAVELREAFERVLKSGQFIMGPDVAEFEKEIASFIGAKHAIGVSSGTDAILLALLALGIGPGDEVLCPTFTFFATAGCIARVGAVPVFVDADAVTFNLDVADAAQKISARTKAIIPVHLFGQCADMDAVMELARKHGLAVIEDAAQSLGAKYKSRSAGTIGTFGVYSFFPSKNLGALGDAGMLVCNDDDLAEKARLLRAHGAKPKYYHKLVGGNFRLDSLQAAFLRVKLPYYRHYTARRRANAAFYTEKLTKIAGVILATDAPKAGTKMVLPVARPECDHIWNQYTVRVLGIGRRDVLRQNLAERGIGHEIYYPVPMHKQECFSYLGAQNSCPSATRLAEEVLSIPIFPELQEKQLQSVIGELEGSATERVNAESGC
jgi:dTDP-4-amino-4,6-dideoxygalactose transaminase